VASVLFSTARAPARLAQDAQTVATTLAVRVSGPHLVDGSGRVVQLRGVDRSGTEYACVQGWGIFDGPSDATSVAAMASWDINAVRLPLNEDCWLGINGVSPTWSGANYRSAVESYVALLHRYGLYVILDLHWNAPGSQSATGQEPMADRDHSPAFWTSVATAFRSDPAVLFDLYNEPYPDSNQDTTAAWTCWKSGGTCPGVGYQAAGMQELVSAVRSAGATNVIMLGGVEYAGQLDHWSAYAPSDPDHQLAASVHSYDFAGCTTTACWNNNLAGAGSVPVITGEVGESGSGGSYVSAYTTWADAHGVSYLGWTWDVWGCAGQPVLISGYDGTPCPGYGVAYKAHLAAAANSSAPGGYWLAAADGGVFAYGHAGWYGSEGGKPLVRPIVGLAGTADLHGYWLVASDGGVFSFGDAAFHGSAGNIHLAKPVVGMAATPDGGGYWLVASDGGIFAYGDAVFHGSAGNIHLAKPVVGMAATPDGGGYWLVASDGGIFAYGDARFYGSAGGLTLTKPVVGMAVSPGGGGYWLVASDGGVFNYGHAVLHGSAGSTQLAAPVVGLTVDSDGGGYWLAGADGAVYSYGDAPDHGSAAGLPLAAPVVGVATGA
jgi:hypothetical protein